MGVKLKAVSGSRREAVVGRGMSNTRWKKKGPCEGMDGSSADAGS